MSVGNNEIIRSFDSTIAIRSINMKEIFITMYVEQTSFKILLLHAFM